jgi:hypothetical protein
MTVRKMPDGLFDLWGSVVNAGVILKRVCRLEPHTLSTVQPIALPFNRRAARCVRISMLRTYIIDKGRVNTSARIARSRPSKYEL